MHRPLCGCRCGCRRRPGRLVLCVRCRARIGPGCCLARESRTRWGRGLCHVCHDGEPEHEVYSSVEVYEDEMVADGLDTLATGVLPPGGMLPLGHPGDGAPLHDWSVSPVGAGPTPGPTPGDCTVSPGGEDVTTGEQWPLVSEDGHCGVCGHYFYRRFLWRCGYCSLVMCVPRQCASNHVRRCPPRTRFSSPHTCADHCPFSEARRLANMNDQLNGGIVACFEPAAREVQIQEQRYADRVIQDVDSERATPSGASTLGNRCILPQLGTYLSEQLDINNDAEKERRKARDERGLPRPPKKGAGQSA